MLYLFAAIAAIALSLCILLVLYFWFITARFFNWLETEESQPVSSYPLISEEALTRYLNGESNGESYEQEEEGRRGCMRYMARMAQPDPTDGNLATIERKSPADLLNPRGYDG